jgi:hypothetical protein
MLPVTAHMHFCHPSPSLEKGILFYPPIIGDWIIQV